jgi:iron-sulfur cluster assembly accessory protein
MNKIKVTTNAWKKITDILKKSNNNIGFIYSASSGGCNGFNFELNLLNKENHKQIINNKFHTVLNNEDSKIYVDPLSELYLLGTTIDYIQEDYSKGHYESKFDFKINKELMTSCGCGISFSLK